MSTSDAKGEKGPDAEPVTETAATVQATQHQTKRKAATSHVPSVATTGRVTTDHISPRSAISPRIHTPSTRKSLDPHVLLQSLLRAALLRQEQEKLKKLLMKRKNIAMEIVATEKNFVTRINVIVNLFKRPLEQSAESDDPMINKAQLRVLFSDLEVIVGLNTELLADLEAHVANFHPRRTCIAEPFLKYGAFFRWYHSYISNYDRAFKLLTALKKSPRMKSFLSTQEARPECNYADLESLLILPIQRIPQYNLLLADIAKATPEFHPDHAACRQALSLLQEIGNYVNEKKREAENIRKVVSIGESIIGFPNLAVPYRRHAIDSRFLCVNSFTLGAIAKQVHVYVFNDVILLAEEKDGQQTVEQYSYYDRLTVIPSPVTDIPEAWALEMKGVRFNFLADNAEQKKRFCDTISEAAELVRKKERELEEAKEARRALLRNATSATSPQMSSSLGILASGLAVDDSDLMNTSTDNLEESVATEDAATRKAQEKVLRAKAKERIVSQVLSIITKEKNGENQYTKIDEYLSHLGIQAHFVAPVRMEHTTHRGSTGQPGSSTLSSAVVQSAVGVSSTGAALSSHHLILITPWSVHIVAKKVVLFSTFLLDIGAISSPQHPDLIITSRSAGRVEFKSEFCDDIIYQIRKTMKSTFPGLIEPTVEVDSWRLFPVKVDIKKLPLGGYATTYKAMCHYFGISVRDDILWDMSHTETKVDRHFEFNLKHFEQPMELDDLRCVLGALKYNTYFTALVMSNIHTTKESFAIVADIFKTNATISKLSVANCAITKEGWQQLHDAILSNPSGEKFRLKHVDISNNVVEERGLAFLQKHVETAKELALQHIDLSGCGVPKAVLASLFNSLRKSASIWRSLSYLNLSNNKIDGEALSAVASFLATPNAVKSVSLAGCSLKMDTIVEAVMRGCLFLTSLDLSKNRIQKGAAQLLGRMLQASATLVNINVCATSIPPESLAEIIKIISLSQYLESVRLLADDNDFGAYGGIEIGKAASSMRGISELSLKNNDFGDEGLTSIFKGLSGGFKTSAIRESFSAKTVCDLVTLNVDGNFKLKNNTARDIMLTELINAIRSPRCSKLQKLSMTGGQKSASQLRGELGAFIAAVSQSNLVELNISGHRMGYKGAVALARTLRVNRKLANLYWDDNALSMEALDRVISQGMAHNESLLVCPVPVIDIAAMVTAFQSDSSTGSEKIAKLEELVSKLQQTIAANHAANARRQIQEGSQSQTAAAGRPTRAVSGGAASAKPSRKSSGPLHIALPGGDAPEGPMSSHNSPRKKEKISTGKTPATARAKSGSSSSSRKTYTIKSGRTSRRKGSTEEIVEPASEQSHQHKIAASQAAGVAKRLSLVRNSGEFVISSAPASAERSPPPSTEPSSENIPRKKDRTSRRSGQPLKNATMRTAASSTSDEPSVAAVAKRASDDSVIFRTSSKALLPKAPEMIRAAEHDGLESRKTRPRSGVYTTMRPSSKRNSDKSSKSSTSSSAGSSAPEDSVIADSPPAHTNPLASSEPSIDLIILPLEQTTSDQPTRASSFTLPSSHQHSTPIQISKHDDKAADERDTLVGSAPLSESPIIGMMASSLSTSVSNMPISPHILTARGTDQNPLEPAWDESGSTSESDDDDDDDENEVDTSGPKDHSSESADAESDEDSETEASHISARKADSGDALTSPVPADSIDDDEDADSDLVSDDDSD